MAGFGRLLACVGGGLRCELYNKRSVRLLYAQKRAGRCWRCLVTYFVGEMYYCLIWDLVTDNGCR